MTSQIVQIKPHIPLYVERCLTGTTSVPDIVIMFGWTNCKLKNLSKVASFWRKKGNYHILYYAASHFPYIYLPYKTAKVCEDFIPYLHEWGVFDSESSEGERKYDNIMTPDEATSADVIKSQRRPNVIAHVFSNGGGAGFAGLIQSLKVHNLPFRYSAIILDSLPGHPGYLHFHRVFTSAQTNIFKKFMTILIVTVLMSFSMPWVILYLAIIRQKRLIKYIVHGLLYEQAAKCPRLFVYSKKDALVPYAAIDRTVRMSIDMKYITNKLVFEDTDHVRHWVDRPEVYEKTVDEFLERCKDKDTRSKVE